VRSRDVPVGNDSTKNNANGLFKVRKRYSGREERMEVRLCAFTYRHGCKAAV
jgi:hypothetical protein